MKKQERENRFRALMLVLRKEIQELKITKTTRIAKRIEEGKRLFDLIFDEYVKIITDTTTDRIEIITAIHEIESSSPYSYYDKGNYYGEMSSYMSFLTSDFAIKNAVLLKDLKGNSAVQAAAFDKYVREKVQEVVSNY